MTNISILIISVATVLITVIICATIFIMSWYDNWRRCHINSLKKYIEFQYKIYRDRPEMETIFLKEFNAIMKQIKSTVDKL